MGRNKVDKTGEAVVNTFGSKMVIIRYRTNKDMDVYFPQYDYVAKNVQYGNFKKGNIKCPYERTVYGVGYIGEGNYRVSENGKHTRIYSTWCNMLQRCYDEKLHKKRPTYKDCKVDENWHNFQNFGSWDKDNFYQIEGEVMCLDKDILVKHNKIYSPETCIYVPKTINSLFVKRDNDRGESIIGTSPYKNDKHRASCSLINPETGKSKRKHLGYYDTELEAFEVYKYYKEKNIKQVADYYKDLIPVELYNGMCNYKVEIDD